MIKKIFNIIFILLAVVMLTACSNNIASSEESSAASSEDSKSKISVVVSFNPLKEFAEAVGKEKVSIKVMVPEGTEPHDFEPKPRDMESLMKAKIFVYNGLGMESWVDKTLQAANNENLKVINSSKDIEPIKNGQSGYDPHIWLSLKNAEIEAKNIKDALVDADSSNKDYYEKNYSEFVSKLDRIYKEYKSKFDGVSNKNFVTGHAAFAYLCKDFSLNMKSVEDVFADGEPTPQKMKELVDYSKSNNIKVIFMEEMASPKVSETLANEVGAKVEKIYTIESKEDNKNYIESMETNLEKIYDSLK